MKHLGLETNLNMINENQAFPTIDMNIRNARYRLNERRRSGEYANNMYLTVQNKDGVEKKLGWNILKLNKFKLYTNKMDSLLFNRDPLITAGDDDTTVLVNKLVNRTQWIDGIRQAIRNMETYGDAPIKTHSGGVSPFSPVNAFKVVDEHDKTNVKYYVLVDYLKDNDNTITHIRFETHLKGYVYERVYEYKGSILGKPVQYNIKDRTISVNGNWYATGVNDFVIQWLLVDSQDGVYGQSPYEDFAPLVHEVERRLTLQNKILDAHSEPMLAVGAGLLVENEITGRVEPMDVLGNIVEVPSGYSAPQYVTWDGKLDNSQAMVDSLFSQIYEVTELGKTFMTGEYTGNISEESLDKLVKSALDRGERHVWDIYFEVRKSLYVLCKLNGLNVDIEDLNIVFQVGQMDSITTIANVINSRVEKGTLSVESALQRFDGYTEKQAIEEVNRIKAERGELIQ